MPGANADLIELLRRVAGRDRVAFEQLYRATNAKIYGVLLGILNRRSLADEALQDVFAKIWERAGDYDSRKSSPITWMAAIARNRALDEIRRAKAAPTSEMPEGFDAPAEVPHTLDRLEYSDQLKSLMVCLDRLEPDRRDLILLAYYRGLSRENLAGRYDRPVATIKTWLHRSLIQLRGCLDA